MPWVKLDDGFWSNPKVQEVGNAAAGAYARMLSYCGQNLTDGLVTDGVAHFITDTEILGVLVAHGFLERDGENWRIRDFLDYNPSREDAEKERAEARDRMRKLRSKGKGRR